MKEVNIKRIENYENYTITEDAIITNTKTGKILKNSFTKDYYQVCLCKNGIRKHFSIHQLLAIAFLGNYDPTIHEVDHKNRNKKDNSLSNLEIKTKRFNHHNRKDQSQTGIGVQVYRNKFICKISINNKFYYLGYYDNAEDASNKYKEVANQINKLDLENRKYKVVRVKKNGEYFLNFLLNN